MANGIGGKLLLLNLTLGNKIDQEATRLDSYVLLLYFLKWVSSILVPWYVKNIIALLKTLYTVKLGYNKQLRTSHFCSL